MPLCWAELNWDKKLSKNKKCQKCLAWPPLSGYMTKSLLQSQFDVKKGLLAKGLLSYIANELFRPILRVTESSYL